MLPSLNLKNAKSRLNLDTSELTLIALLSYGLAGSLTMPTISRRFT
jgi:hypothetical protein